MSLLAISFILGLYWIDTCSSRTCQCLFFNQPDCDRSTECKWFPDNTICRSIQWVFCEIDEKCKADREQRKINREPEPDFDWPFDCPEWYDEEVREDDDVDPPETTQLSCEEIGELNGKTCECADFSACIGLDCEPGPQVTCDNGGICCCGSTCTDKGPPGGGGQGPPPNGGPRPGGGPGGGSRGPAAGGGPPPQSGGRGSGGGGPPPNDGNSKVKISDAAPPPPQPQIQSKLLSDVKVMKSTIQFGYLEFIGSLIVCIGIICIGVLCCKDVLCCRQSKGDYKPLSNDKEYRCQYSTFEHV